jgi:unsaturated chondroitin disaccharide hydrolase
MKRHGLFFLLLLSITCPLPGQANPLDGRIKKALTYAQSQLHTTVRMLGDSVKYPRSSDLKGVMESVPPDDWTSGFFPGVLWNMAEYAHDTTLRAAADRWTRGLEEQKFNTRTHDVGFMMYCSYGNANRLEPSPDKRAILLQSARSLIKRYNPVVGCIKSWDGRKEWPYPVIIDNMMNLELLFWAASHGGGPVFSDIAVSHALKTMANHVRADGSTYHVVDYDTLTGAVVRKQTSQGFADESVWARGQAWGIYGFTMVYRETHDPRFLETAQRVADFFIGHLPADHIPYWDFKAPGIPNTERDASAGAIAASGLLELSTLTKEVSRRSAYLAAAEGILTSLTAPPYLSEGTASHGIINHSVGHHPKNSEIDVSLIYGDYYAVEAMLRYLARATFGSVKPTRTRSQVVPLTVTNPLDMVRPFETISLPWADVQRRLGINPGTPVAVFSGTTELPCQRVDADFDGIPEEFLFQWTFGRNEKKEFVLKTTEAARVFESKVDARFVVPREDIGWESDRIAYRIYGSPLAGDVLNGVDVWVKRVRSLVVDKWYKANERNRGAKDSYHEDHGEGADFFSVGRTLGAGGCGLLKNGVLYQPGIFSSYIIHARGPIRASFTVVYENGRMDGVPFREVKTYSLDAGHNLNRIDVTYSGFGTNEQLTLLTGLVKRKDTKATSNTERGWVALWGPTNDNPTNEYLGTGVVLSPGSVGALRDDSVHAAFTCKAVNGIPVTYYAGASWTRSGDVANARDWEQFLDSWALGLREPVKVTWPDSPAKP